MDVDEIAVVRSRASQLRPKINNCIDKATQRKNSEDENSNHLLEEAEDEDDEAESLLNIREALESLEEQLGSLQVSCFFFFRIWVFSFLPSYLFWRSDFNESCNLFIYFYYVVVFLLYFHFVELGF